MWESLARPEPAFVSECYDNGWWRRQTFLDDVVRAATERPDAPAIIEYQGGEPTRTIRYGELVDIVDRFAGGLSDLGVGAGDVVLLYLPNVWLIGPMYLACARLGAVAFPLNPAFSARELGLALRVDRVKVCVTVDRYDGKDFAGPLARLAPPEVHRVVVGDARRTGALDFDATFLDRAGLGGPVVGPDPDSVALLLFTSGTSGQPKCIAHSYNTLYAAVRSVSVPCGLGPDDTITVPLLLTNMAGSTYSVLMPLHLGATCVLQDGSDMDLVLDMIERHGVTFVYAVPSYVQNLLAAQRSRPRDTRTLRHLVSGSTPVPPQLVDEVTEVLGVELRALWGMTENGAVTMTRPDDPPGWASRSDGRPEPWMRVRIEPDESGDPDVGRLLVRGANQCLGYLGQPDVYRGCLDDEGWFDTGDTARDDGRGGIRITGRRNDLIIRASGMKVPTLDVEALLQRHPLVREAVLIGYPDPNTSAAELVCAVVVPDGTAPSLAQLRDHLAGLGVGEVYWPDRIELLNALPRNSLGKVQRNVLRAELATAHPSPESTATARPSPESTASAPASAPTVR
ncbi:MAG TPA: AMP-binding protein [Micromonosporaceae bacterium]